jgi:hypothetical protein
VATKATEDENRGTIKKGLLTGRGQPPKSPPAPAPPPPSPRTSPTRPEQEAASE